MIEGARPPSPEDGDDAPGRGEDTYDNEDLPFGPLTPSVSLRHLGLVLLFVFPIPQAGV